MSVFLYNVFLLFYGFFIRGASLFNSKAALWIAGRKGLQQKIAATLKPGEQRIWMHCASLGEFEQGRPVIDALRLKYPDYKIVLTFFSPSGYEISKDYSGADYVFYLPMDGYRAAKQFLDSIAPRLVIFVKYEFWYYYLKEAKARAVPTILIAAAFRKEQAFFKRYGDFFRKILSCFTHILVQDQASKNLLISIGFGQHIQVAGDTRYDRVSAIAAKAWDLLEIKKFKGNNKLLIGGSTWPDDERVLHTLLPELPPDWKMIIAPHEIDKAHLENNW